MSASELFLPTTHENGPISTIYHQRWRYYNFLRPPTLENPVELAACTLVSSRRGRSRYDTRDSLPLPTLVAASRICFFAITTTGLLRLLLLHDGRPKPLSFKFVMYSWSLDNDFKSPVCMLVTSRGGRLQDGRRHSLTLSTFFSVLKFFPVTHHNRGYFRG